jgi:hypothetical protein
LRFAVHRPGIPDASPRSHGAPAARPPRPARPTARPAATRRFLPQPTHQQSPARPHDLAVEPGLSSYIPARVLPCSSRRSDHALDKEVFDPDHVEPARNVRTGLLGPVLAPVRLASMQPGDRVPHSSAAVRTSPRAGKPALKPSQSIPFPCSESLHVQQLTRRKSRGYRHAPVDSYGFAIAGRRDRIWNSREGDVPASCAVHRHPIGLYPRRHRTRPAEPHPSSLRNPDLADISRQSTHIPLPRSSTHDAETFIAIGLAPRWSPGGVVRVEEGDHGLGEIPPGLLLHHLGACGQPRVLCSCLRKLPTLLQIARRTLAARVPMLMLLHREIPYVPGMSTVVLQHCFLRRGGEQPVPGHTNILSITADISGEAKRRFPPGRRARVSAPRS